MKRFRYRTLLVAGAALMGWRPWRCSPAAGWSSSSPESALSAGSVRLGTVEGPLTAMLLPPERRGEGLGLYGVVDSLPGVVALPSGVWLAGHCGYRTVVIMAGRNRTRSAGCQVSPTLAQSATMPAQGSSQGMLAVLRHLGELRLSLVFAATTVAAGVVVSFLPPAAGAAANVAAIGLLAQALTATEALTATACRWWAGRHGDRHGHAGLLVPGLAIASCGMAAMIWPLPLAPSSRACAYSASASGSSRTLPSC